MSQGRGLSQHQRMQSTWQENKPPPASRARGDITDSPLLGVSPPSVEVMSTVALPGLEDGTCHGEESWPRTGKWDFFGVN